MSKRRTKHPDRWQPATVDGGSIVLGRFDSDGRMVERSPEGMSFRSVGAAQKTADVWNEEEGL